MGLLQEKKDRLEGLLREIGSLVVAYSGGVDSAYLAVTAHDLLGERALAVTAVSPSLPPGELEEARGLALRFGFRHRVIPTGEVEDPRYAANTPRRCYFCKTELYARLREVALQEGLRWVANGTNTDDLGDYRPGLEAAREFGVRSPLLEAGLTKEEVRVLSRGRGLPIWDKPAQACLSSRIPYGTPVTVEALSRIGRAEPFLRSLGLRQVRVRHHGDLARIEVEPQDIPLLVREEARQAVATALRRLGYIYITLDMVGYRRGSLNEALAPSPAHSSSGTVVG